MKSLIALIAGFLLAVQASAAPVANEPKQIASQWYEAFARHDAGLLEEIRTCRRAAANLSSALNGGVASRLDEDLECGVRSETIAVTSMTRRDLQGSRWRGPVVRANGSWSPGA
jgi:hypothetical protein